MSFRRDGAKSHEWEQWLTKHRQVLIQCGLPSVVLRDQRHWFNFLGHDGWDAETGWRIEMLSTQQASALNDFLLREYGEDHNLRGLFRMLRERPSTGIRNL